MMNVNYRLHPIPALKDNYIWALYDENTRDVLLVDPGDAEPVLAYLHAEQLKPCAILVTHHHWDHTNGLTLLKQHFDIPVYGSHLNRHPEITMGLEHADHIMIPQLKLKLAALAVPGHTLDHTAFYSAPYVFTGDTLFSGGCGRLFEGTPAQMWASLQRLMALPDDTTIYCGHEYTLNNLTFAKLVEPDNQALMTYYTQVERLHAAGLPTLPTDLAREKAINPFLRVETPTVIAAVSHHVNERLTDPVSVFQALRAWKTHWG